VTEFQRPFSLCCNLSQSTHRQFVLCTHGRAKRWFCETVNFRLLSPFVQDFLSPRGGKEAVADCTAMPGQPAAGWKQAPSTRHPSKIQLTRILHIGVIQVLIWIEQILHYDLSQKAEKRYSYTKISATSTGHIRQNVLCKSRLLREADGVRGVHESADMSAKGFMVTFRLARVVANRWARVVFPQKLMLKPFPQRVSSVDYRRASSCP